MHLVERYPPLDPWRVGHAVSLSRNLSHGVHQALRIG